MNRDKRNIDLLFEEKLRQFKETPPASSWQRLEQDLNRGRSARRLFYVRLAAASILLLLAFGAGYFYATYQSEPKQELSSDLISPEKETGDQAINPATEELNIALPKEDVQTASNRTHAEKQNLIKPADGKVLQNTGSAESERLIVKNETTPQEVIIDKQEIAEVIVAEDQTIADEQETNPIALNKEEVSADEKKTEYVPLMLDPDAKEYGMESTHKKDAKWSVGAQVAPVYSYRDISINYANQSGNNAKDVEDQLNEQEEALITYAGGVDINYNLGKKWSLLSGMYYSKIGQVNNNALNFEPSEGKYLLYAIRTSTGSIDFAFENVPDDVRKINPPKDTLSGIDLNNVKIIQNFDLFEVPFMIRYKILDKRFGINISGGLSPAYVLKNSTILEVDNDKYNIGSSSNLNNMIFNTSIALGLNYGISKKLSISLEPNFKYSLSPINNNSQFDYHPYYLSWFTGISYKF